MTRTASHRELSDFRQNAGDHLDRLAETGEIEVLTVDGEVRGVVMSPEAYRELAEKAALQESLAMLDRSMEDIKAGRVKDFRQAIRDIAKELGLELNR